MLAPFAAFFTPLLDTWLAWDVSWRMAWVAVLGLCVGSFIGLLQHRLPALLIAHIQYQQPMRWKALAFPASYCPQCRQSLSCLAKLPLCGFIIYAGRCQHCQQPIAWHYPAIELAAAALCLFAAYHYPHPLDSLMAAVLLLSLLLLSLIDQRCGLLPHCLTLPLLGLGLLHHVNSVQWMNAVLGAVLGYLLLWATATGFFRLTGQRGMGDGDFTLFAAIGANLGLDALPWVLVGSSSLCVLVYYTKSAQASTIPFGPYLSMATLLYMMYFT